MAKDYSAEQLAVRTFVITMAGIGLFIATVFISIL
jgi:hypothetical protein